MQIVLEIDLDDSRYEFKHEEFTVYPHDMSPQALRLLERVVEDAKRVLGDD